MPRDKIEIELHFKDGLPSQRFILPVKDGHDPMQCVRELVNGAFMNDLTVFFDAEDGSPMTFVRSADVVFARFVHHPVAIAS